MAREHTRTAGACLMLLASVAALSCGGVQVAPSAPLDQSATSLYPLRAGYAWSYDVDSGDGQSVLATSRVVRVHDGSADVMTGQAIQTYLIRPEGIQKSSGAFFLLPAALDASSHWASGPDAEARVISTQEQLQTPAGSFRSCVAVQEQNRSSGQQITTTYCPAVGPVRVVSQMEVRGQIVRVEALLRGYTSEAL